MYERFYAFTRAPFANVPDPAFMAPRSDLRRAANWLEHSLLSRTGICVVTGAIGAGKTTLMRHLMGRLGDRYCFGLVSNPQCADQVELLRWIALAFELDFHAKDATTLTGDFIAFLRRCEQAGKPATLVIDEAQHLSATLLEGLRILADTDGDRGLLLQVVLVGQPELAQHLQAQQLTQLRQRIVCRCNLEPLANSTAVQRYIEHRLQVAGAAPGLFATDTFPLIERATGGVPRLINQLCDAILVAGYAGDSRHIDAALVRQVISNRAGSLWLGNADPTLFARDTDASAKRQVDADAPTKHKAPRLSPESSTDPAVAYSATAQEIRESAKDSAAAASPASKAEAEAKAESEAEVGGEIEAEVEADSNATITPKFEPTPKVAVAPARAADRAAEPSTATPPTLETETRSTNPSTALRAQRFSRDPRHESEPERSENHAPAARGVPTVNSTPRPARSSPQQSPARSNDATPAPRASSTLRATPDRPPTRGPARAPGRPRHSGRAGRQGRLRRSY